MQVKFIQNPTNGDVIFNFREGSVSSQIIIPAAQLDNFHEVVKKCKLAKDQLVNKIIVPDTTIVRPV